MKKCQGLSCVENIIVCFVFLKILHNIHRSYSQNRASLYGLVASHSRPEKSCQTFAGDFFCGGSIEAERTFFVFYDVRHLKSAPLWDSVMRILLRGRTAAQHLYCWTRFFVCLSPGLLPHFFRIFLWKPMIFYGICTVSIPFLYRWTKNFLPRLLLLVFIEVEILRQSKNNRDLYFWKRNLLQHRYCCVAPGFSWTFLEKIIGSKLLGLFASFKDARIKTNTHIPSRGDMQNVCTQNSSALPLKFNLGLPYGNCALEQQGGGDTGWRFP